MSNTKNIYLLVGPSGSGKSSVAKWLTYKHGLYEVDSYTDRKPRFYGEKGHRFVDSSFFVDHWEELCAYTVFNGFQYGVLDQDIETAEVYVIDPPGLQYLKAHYHGKRKMRVIYLTAEEETLRDRMSQRSDSPEMIEQRVINDRYFFDLQRIGITDFDLIIHTDRFTSRHVAQFVWNFIEMCEEEEINRYA